MVVTARIITTKCTFSWLLLLLGIVVSVRAGIKPAADDRAKEIIKGAVDDRGSQEASSIDYTATAAVDDRGGHKVEDAIKKNKVDEDSSLDYTTTAAVDDRGGHKVDDAIKKTTTEDCMILETNIIADVLALGQDSKNQLFDTIERLQSRLHGEKQCTDSEWRINYGHLSYYKIGDGSPDGVGCHDLPLMGLDVTGMEWPYDTNDKGVNHQDFPAATVRKGMCNSGIPGMVLQCTPEPIQAKYSYDRPTNTCPRVYCVTDADPLVAGEYWEDLSNFVQDQVPRYIKGAIDTTAYLDCRGVPPPAIETTPPTPKQSLEDTCDGKKKVPTKLDFYDATLTENTLHYPDQSGRLRYAGVGVVHGESIDLVVTQHPGSAPYSTDMSIRNGYNRGDDPENPDTRWERFGNINVMTKDPRDELVSDKEKAFMNGEATFDFCFYYTGTEETATVDSFDWSVYDLDFRGGGLNEKFTIDTSQAQFYRVQGDTEVKMWCENEGPASAIQSGTFTYQNEEGETMTVDRYKPVTCDPGVNTIFHSTSKGKLEDNPTDPEKLTKQQLSRSIEFRFANTSCWTFKYEHYCPCDNYCKEDGGGPSTSCSKEEWCPQSTKDHKDYDKKYPNACKSYSGGNFLFAGTADEKITEEGECVTSSPTTAPETESSTFSPTLVETEMMVTEPPTSMLSLPGTDYCTDFEMDEAEQEIIQRVIALGKDSKHSAVDTITRLYQEWGVYYDSLRYYKLGGDGSPELPDTRPAWPYDTNNKGVNAKDFPAATVREGMCASPPGLVLNCTPEPVQKKYSYDRPTNTCPRVYCVTDTDPLVAGEYWEDISNIVQDQVPRYIKGKIDTSQFQACSRPPPPPPAAQTEPPTEPETLIETEEPTTDAPSAAFTTISPTRSPIAEATTVPPKEESDRPTQPPREPCFDDIIVQKVIGTTDYPASSQQQQPPVTIVNKDETTVTVALHQSWTNWKQNTTVDHIFASYKPTIWNQVCVEAQDVSGGGTQFDTITITCNIMSPRAYLTLCVADENILSFDDTAVIPKCCHPDTIPPTSNTVCYLLDINCRSECSIEETTKDRRYLRNLLQGN